jgi:glutathione S-transferase
MRFYYAPGSSSLASHIVLREADLPFSAIKVDEHTKAMEGGGDYRSINPLGFVPALQLEDGTLVTEGVAIMQYIADRVPHKNLAPPNGTMQRVKLQSWLNFISSELHKGGFSPLFYEGIPEEGREVFRRRLVARFTYLDAHLAENDYLMGRDYSVADAHLFTVSNWASWVRFDLSPFGAAVTHRARVSKRSAVRAAMEVEGLVPWPSEQPR